MNSLSRLLSLLPLVLLTFLLTSCGKPQVVKNVHFISYEKDSQIWGKLDAELYFGNISFPTVNLPIIHPRNFSNIGSLSLKAQDGKNFMAVDINLTEVARLNPTQAKLPNGGTLPLIGTHLAVDLQIPGAKNLHLYLSVTENEMALGVAMSFAGMDQIGQRLGTANLFPVFNVGNIKGSAGVFTSRNAGENGFGLFADLSNLVHPALKAELFTSSGDISVQAQIPANESAINNELFQMHKNNSRLILAH